MPLLTCPIDGSPMQQIVRYGIELDVSKNGVWLDKGELEKLMQMIREAAEDDIASRAPPVQQKAAPVQHVQQAQPQVVYQQPPQVVVQQMPRRDWDDDDYKKHQYYGSHGKYYKKSKMSKIMDIFDF